RGRYAGELRRRLVRKGPFHDWVDPAVVSAAADDFLAGRREIGLQIWRWLALEAWSQAYVARDPRVLGRPSHPAGSAGRHLGHLEAAAPPTRSPTPARTP